MEWSFLQAFHKLPGKGIVEWAAFASTLAQRLARMLKAGLISPAHPIWTLAVDSILIKAVDTDTQVDTYFIGAALPAVRDSSGEMGREAGH